MNQDDFIEKLSNMSCGVNLDKEHAEKLVCIVKPLIILSGVKL